jgi:hypothetical protein
MYLSHRRFCTSPTQTSTLWFGILGTPEHMPTLYVLFESRREDVDGECLAVARSIHIYSPVTHTHACGGRLFCIPAHITVPSSAFRKEQHTRISQIWAFRSSIFHKCIRNVFGRAENADKHLAFWCLFFQNLLHETCVLYLLEKKKDS